MGISEKHRGVTLNIARQADLAELSDLLGSVFSKRDPPAVAAGFSKENLEALARVFGAKSIQEKLSFVAREKDTGRMIGVALAHDFGRPPSNEIAALIPYFEPLLAFLEQLDEKYTSTKTVVAGSFLHIFMIAVDEAWSGKGIAQQLVRECTANGGRHGYHTAFTEATSEVSRCVFRNNGFEEQYFASYEDFEFKGSFPFASIHEHKGCALMDMKIA